MNAFGMGPLIGIESPSATQRWRLVRALYDQAGPVLLGALSLLGAVLCAWARTGGVALLAIGAINIGVCLFRLWHIRRFKRDPDAHDTPEAWARRFAVGAFAAALLWGAASWAAVRTGDPFAALFVLAIASGYSSAAVVRNSPSPPIAIGQTVVIAVMVAAACVGTGRWEYQALAILSLIQVAANVQISRFLNAQMGMLMQAERGQAELNTILERMSFTDELTGIANRRGFEQALQREWDRGARTGQPLALIMADVDHFKAYNDTYGHPMGDLCLRAVATAASNAVQRPGDVVARFGGEEIAILLPETAAAGALALAERVRAAISALGIQHGASPFRFLTISLGVAVEIPAGGRDPIILVERADAALYRAKREGRNKVGGEREMVGAAGFEPTAPSPPD